MDSNIDKVREALIKLRSYAKSFGCDYQEECTLGEDDMCQSCEHVYIAELALAALSAIDPEAIRREIYLLQKQRKEVHKLVHLRPSPTMIVSMLCNMTERHTIELAKLSRSAILCAEPAQDDGKPEVGDDLETVAQVIQYHISAGGEYEYRGKIAMESFERIKRRLEEAKE